MSEAPEKGSYLGQAWLVILLALIYGGALAGVQTTLGPIIAENKKRETYDTIENLIDGADKDKTGEVMVMGADGKEQVVYRANAADGTLMGWVLPASGLGFADRIDLLIGLSADLSTITGLYVLDHKETPGLGDKITSSSFLCHFKDQPAEPSLVVVGPNTRTDLTAKVDGEIVAVSSATISSDSVAEIVNKAIANFREPIRKMGSGFRVQGSEFHFQSLPESLEPRTSNSEPRTPNPEP